MKDIIVSIAEFKSHLSQFLSDSRKRHQRIILMNRKTPVATVVPYDVAGFSTTRSGEGLAELAGSWNDLVEIGADINASVAGRQNEEYREVPF